MEFPAVMYKLQLATVFINKTSGCCLSKELADEDAWEAEEFYDAEEWEETQGLWSLKQYVYVYYIFIYISIYLRKFHFWTLRGPRF